MSALFFVAPLVTLIGYSFTGASGLTLDNYVRFLSDPFNFRVLVDTFRLGTMTITDTNAALVFLEQALGVRISRVGPIVVILN